jgi:hypothetical protein
MNYLWDQANLEKFVTYPGQFFRYSPQGRADVSLFAPVDKSRGGQHSLLTTPGGMILKGDVMTFIAVAGVYILLLVMVLAPLMLSSRISRCLKEDELSVRSANRNISDDLFIDSLHNPELHSEVTC